MSEQALGNVAPEPAIGRLSGRTPDIGALELLLSVERFGSLGQAAAWHGITQPAAGSRIRHLELQLGLALIERSARGSRLTADGTVVADWAREVVRAAVALDEGAATLRNGRKSRLRLAASLTIAECLMPEWIAKLRHRRPEAAVSMQVVNSKQVVLLVVAGVVDLGFVECPDHLGDLQRQVVGHDELFAVVSPSHRWAQRTSPLPARELAATPLVCREDGSGTRCTLEGLLAAHGGPVPPAVELSSTTAVKAAVIAGVGPAVVSNLAITNELAAGKLERVAVDPSLDLHRRLHAIWPADRSLTKISQELLDLAAAELR